MQKKINQKLATKDSMKKIKKEVINNWDTLQQNIRGKYRLKCEVDKVTNDFPKTLKDTYEDADVYIDCSFGNKIFYYGKGILQSYIPSLQRGRNIIRNEWSYQVVDKDNNVYAQYYDREYGVCLLYTSDAADEVQLV